MGLMTERDSWKEKCLAKGFLIKMAIMKEKLILMLLPKVYRWRRCSSYTLKKNHQTKKLLVHLHKYQDYFSVLDPLHLFPPCLRYECLQSYQANNHQQIKKLLWYCSNFAWLWNLYKFVSLLPVGRMDCRNYRNK